MLEIPNGIWEDLIARARAAAPIEACGILAGRDPRVERIYPMTNADRSGEHFSLLPEEQFAVARDIRRRGLAMLALYHSHPATPARMSEEDLRLAFTPGIAYAIVSLADPDAHRIAAFRVAEGRPHADDIRRVEDPPGTFRMPEEIRRDTAAYRRHVADHLSGTLPPERLRPLRVPMGIYEQRVSGLFMVRVRLPGGEITPAILRALARLARAHGSGRLHVTTRQDVQIHDVAIERTPDLLDALLEHGLSPRGGGGNTVRNITACPLAGVCPREVFDVSPYVAALTEHYLTDRSSFELPRKFKACFSGCEDDCAWSIVADVGFVACVRDGRPGFRVYGGGGMGQHSRVSILLEEFVPEDEFLSAGEAVKRLFERHGDRMNRHRARLRFVLDRAGEEGFRDLYRQERAAAGRIPPSFAPIARRRDGTAPAVAPTAGAEPADPSFAAWRDANAIAQKQPGLWAARIPIQLGDLSAEEAEALAGAIEASGAAWARATQEQGLLAGGMHEAGLGALHASLARIREDLVGLRPLLHPVACAGASTCRLGLCLSRNLARALIERIEREALTSPALNAAGIRVSGCPNACGQHPISDIGLHGVARRIDGRLLPFYRVFAGVRRGQAGRALSRPAGEIPARAIPDAIAEFLRGAGGEIRPGESFADYIDRAGFARLESALASRSRVASYAEDPSFYRDFGVEEEFSLAGRGPGECGAGLLDLVAVDLAEARKALDESKAAAGAARDQALYRAIASACRALLELRGIEPPSDRALFRAFEDQLIEPAWFARSTREALDAALDWRLGDRSDLAGAAPGIAALVDRADALFRSLDSALRFTLPKAEGDGAKPQATGLGETARGSTHPIDLRGVPCPINFARAKIALEAIPPGEILEILLDDGEPVKNVPASFRSQGQEVLSVEAMPEGHHRVRVRRAGPPR